MRDEDILVRLDSKNMFDHLISAIFKNLDAKSISNSENVSSEWSDIIETNRIWQNYFKCQMLENNLFSKYLKLRGLRLISENERNDLDTCRHISSMATRSIDNLETCWKTGPCRQEVLEFDDSIMEVKLSESHILVLLHNRNPFRVQHFDASMVYCNVYSRETFLLEHVIFFRNATGIFDSFICDHLFYIAFERATPGFQTSTWIKVINLNSMLEIQYFQLCTSSISMFRIENDFLYFIPGDNPTQLKYYPIIRNNINNSILLGRLQTMKFQESISTFKTDSDLMVVGFESGTIKFMKNHFEIQTIRHHTSPVKSIGVIRNNSNLDFITSCHDQINLWRLDEGITLLRSIPAIIFDPSVLCYSMRIYRDCLNADNHSPLLIFFTNSSVFTFDYNILINSDHMTALESIKPMPLLIRSFDKIVFDHFQMVLFNFNQLLLGDMFVHESFLPKQ